MECIFVDLNKDFINIISELCKDLPFVTCICDDVSKMPLNNTVFVSPANSIGFMDFGVDDVYNTKMFYRIQYAVQKKIKELDIKTALGRYCLPVGSAIIVPAIPETHTYLISAPTMFLPQNVSKTKNAYHSFMACMCLLKKYNSEHIKKIVCPGLCTGVGFMDTTQAAQQIYQAILDFKTLSNVPPQISYQDDKTVYITDFKNEEQPNYYENLEIKNINILDIVFHR